MIPLTVVVTGVMVAPSMEFPPIDKLPSVPTLPDPLTSQSGQPITSIEDWRRERAPELRSLFQHYMYGQYPSLKTAGRGHVLFEDSRALGGRVTLREIALTMVPDTPPVQVLISIPNHATQPVPVFVGLNFGGNHTLTDHPQVRIPTAWMRPNRPTPGNQATADGRNRSPDAYPLDLAADRGYAIVTAYYGEIIPDDPKVRGGLSDVLMPTPCCDNRPGDETGAIMAWAWGLHRMIDYLVTVPELDSQRIVAVGHSRLGKATLVATAFDERIAIGMPHQAGTGGSGPSRSHNPKAETAKRVATAFPHWFAANFVQFGDDPTKLPFDQHSLVALCAPRPVLFTAATEDQWANPSGQWDVLRAATPVYRLFGVEGLQTTTIPEEGVLLDSRLGYWVRPGAHAMNRDDWRTFLTFADRWLAKK